MSVKVVLGNYQFSIKCTASRKRYKIKTSSLEGNICRLLSLTGSQDLRLVYDHRVERHFDIDSPTFFWLAR